MAGSGNTQIINGQEYKMYTPAWYAAMQAETQRQAGAKGAAAGTELSAASKAAGIPIGGSNITIPPSLTGLTSAVTGATGGPSTVPSPSMMGLSAAASGGGNAPIAMPGVPSSGGSGGSGGGSTGSGYSHLAPVDTSAAESASFNHAKEQVGQSATGALTGLRSALGSRGMLGSGLEERGTAAAATTAEGQLGDVSREQATTRANLAQKNAETNFTGDITQRGQDFQKEEAANSLAGTMAMGGYSGQITQRGQDIQNANAQKALELEQAQLGAQQRSTALAGLEAALKVSPGGSMY